jgi:hypothetical protein
MHITYTALMPNDQRLAIDCATLNEALELAAAHLAQDVLPVYIGVNGQRFDIEMILALLDARHAAGSGRATPWPKRRGASRARLLRSILQWWPVNGEPSR